MIEPNDGVGVANMAKTFAEESRKDAILDGNPHLPTTVTHGQETISPPGTLYRMHNPTSAVLV